MSNLASNKSTITGGAFQTSSGTRISGGYTTWTLSHDEAVQTLGGPSGAQVSAGAIVVIPLDQLGNAVSGSQLWTNDLLTPSGSYYIVNLHNEQGLQVWNSPQIFVLTYAPTIDIGSLTPVTP